jgi:uncharacterized protein (TIGR03067 family)
MLVTRFIGVMSWLLLTTITGLVDEPAKAKPDDKPATKPAEKQDKPPEKTPVKQDKPAEKSAAKDAPPDDQKLLIGTWLVVKVEVNNKEAPPEVTKDAKLVLTQDRFVVEGMQGGTEKPTFAWKIDPAKNPRQLDLTAENGPYKGRVAKGVYELKMDELKLCLPNDPEVADRPGSFTSAGNLLLLHLKRAKSP